MLASFLWLCQYDGDDDEESSKPKRQRPDNNSEEDEDELVSLKVLFLCISLLSMWNVIYFLGWQQIWAVYRITVKPETYDIGDDSCKVIYSQAKVVVTKCRIILLFQRDLLLVFCLVTCEKSKIRLVWIKF